MNVLKYVKVPSMDPEHLLVEKARLNKEGLLDPVLKTNLQFAVAAMQALSTATKRNAQLLVEGDLTVLKFYTSNQPLVNFAVFQDLEGPKLYQNITVDRPLSASDIDKTYFIGHSCSHNPSCRNKVINMLCHLNSVEFKVICKELRITFTPPQPTETIVFP